MEQTATNPQTGEKIVFRGGQWQPLTGAPQQGPISSGFKPVDPIDQNRDIRDQTRLDILIKQEADRQAKEATELADKTQKEAQQKASMLSRLKQDTKSIVRLGKDANDNAGFMETGASGSFSRDWLPKGTAGYSLQSDLEKFKAKNAFTGLTTLADQGVKLTPVSNEEIKLAAASVANLDPNADHETFMRAVDETMQYYYDMIARIDPIEAYQTALENGENAAAITAIAERNGGPMPDAAILQQAVEYKQEFGPYGGAFEPPEMIGNVPKGTQVEIGFNQSDGDQPYDRNRVLEQLGLDANKEATMMAFWNANRNNDALTLAGVLRWYAENNIPPPNDTDLNEAIEQAKKGAEFGPIDTSAEEAAYRAELQKEATRIMGEAGLSERADQGLLLGYSDEIAGVGGAIGSLIRGDDPRRGYLFQRDVMRYQNEQADRNTGLLGDVVEIGAGLALPAGSVRTVGQGMRTGATVGAVGGFGYGEGAGGSATNALLGGGLGTALGGGGAKLGNVLAARSAAKAEAAPNALQRLIPNAQQVVDSGKAANVRVMTSDIRPPKTRYGKLGRTMGENIPLVGTAGPRAAQQNERTQAVQNLMKEFGADDAAVEAVSADLVATRGATIGRLTDAKKEVIQGIKGNVPTPKAQAQLDIEIAAARKVKTPSSQKMADMLQSYKNSLQQTFKNKPTGILGPDGVPITNKVATNEVGLIQIEDIRKEMGDAFNSDSLANIKKAGEAALRRVYGPLKDDMGAFIEASAGPAAKAKWAGANERLAAMAGELDASGFKNLLNNAETTPENAAKILFGKTPSDMKRLYGSLSDKGKTKAKSAIIFKAAEKAKTNDIVDPTKFATAMEAMSEATGVFFSPADKAQIDGMTRLFQATRGASDAAASPMTGAQNTPFIAGISIAQVFGTAALPVTAIAGLLARAYESGPVRNAFLRLGRTKPKSPQEGRAIKALMSLIGNPSTAAPSLSQAAASDDVSEERPIQP